MLIWAASGDVLHVPEAVPGHGSQIRGWMTCAALAAYLLGRKYRVWRPHGLYKLLLREPAVCRVDVSTLLLELETARLDQAAQATVDWGECMPGARTLVDRVARHFGGSFHIDSGIHSIDIETAEMSTPKSGTGTRVEWRFVPVDGGLG